VNAPELKPTTGYLADPVRLALIFGAFPVLTLPLAYIAFHPSPLGTWVTNAYMGLLGFSHFVITFTVYFNSKNLSFFGQSPINRLAYFAAPALIFGYFAVLSSYDLRDSPTAKNLTDATVAFVAAVTYVHRGRQGYGVLQLFKGQSGLKFPVEQRKLELAFFWSLPLLQAETKFLGHGHFFTQPLGWVTLALVVLLFAMVLRSMISSRQPGNLTGLLVPIGYFLVQTGTQCLSSIDLILYLACDATHYVEYHVLMYPRVKREALGERRIDRLWSVMRSVPGVFYLLLAVVSVMVMAFQSNVLGFADYVSASAGPARWIFFALNGLGLFHFYVDAFIWRFSNSYYRGALSPLYFRRT
jgi:hypothetical protein